MRLNRFIATYSSLSRRKADDLIEQGKVIVNRKVAHPGIQVTEEDSVVVDGKKLNTFKRPSITVILNKPTGYICSKDGQGGPTVYDLLQRRLSHLNVAGRLDKDSSGLVILTDDGKLLQELTHPSFNKKKIYLVTLNKPLKSVDKARLEKGVNIGDDRLSKLKVEDTKEDNTYKITLTEGRNRQIRRTFETIGYRVEELHRIKMGNYSLKALPPEQFLEL